MATASILQHLMAQFITWQHTVKLGISRHTISRTIHNMNLHVTSRCVMVVQYREYVSVKTQLYLHNRL